MSKQPRTEMLKVTRGKEALLEKKYEILSGPDNTKRVVYFDPTPQQIPASLCVENSGPEEF